MHYSDKGRKKLLTFQLISMEINSADGIDNF